MKRLGLTIWIGFFGGLGVLAGSASFLDARSRPSDDVYELEPFRVVATRTALLESEIPASVAGLTMTDLDRLAVADAADLLRFEPLVDLPFDVGGSDAFVPYQSPGYSAYSIRGMDGNRVLLQIDGIRQAPVMSFSGGTRTDLFDPWLLSSLEILKGTASSLYGSDALGGVVALSTRAAVPPGTTRIDAGARHNQTNDELALLGIVSAASGDWAGRLGHVSREASERQNYGDTPENPESMRSRHSIGTVSWMPSNRHHLHFTAEVFHRESSYQLDSAEGFQPQLLLNLTELSFAAEEERRRASVDYTWSPKSGFVEEGRLLFYVQDSATDALSRQVGVPPVSFLPGRDRTDNITFDQTQLGVESGITVGWESGAWEHRLTTGLSLESAAAENDFIRTDRAPVLIVEDLIGMAPSRTWRSAVYLQDEIRWRQWGLIAGMRAEYYSIQPENSEPYVNRLNERLPPGFPELHAVDYQLTSWAPSVAVSYRWTRELMTYGRYARGYRQPTAGEFTGLFFHGAEFVILPNSDLHEEVSDAWEVGTKWFSKRVEVQVAAFTTDYDGFFETVATGERLDPGDPLSLEIQQIRNVAAARISGYEISSRWHLLPPNADVRTRLQLIATVGQAWGENRTTGDSLASISPLKAVGGLSWEAADGKWNVLLTATYRAKHHEPPPETLFVPDASLVWDLSGSYHVTDWLLLEGGVRNLTDERYHLWANSNQGIHFADDPDRSTLPGRNFFAGVRVRF